MILTLTAQLDGGDNFLFLSTIFFQMSHLATGVSALAQNCTFKGKRKKTILTLGE